jgi:hypothetical protein
MLARTAAFVLVVSVVTATALEIKTLTAAELEVRSFCLTAHLVHFRRGKPKTIASSHETLSSAFSVFLPLPEM